MRDMERLRERATLPTSAPLHSIRGFYNSRSVPGLAAPLKAADVWSRLADAALTSVGKLAGAAPLLQLQTGRPLLSQGRVIQPPHLGPRGVYPGPYGSPPSAAVPGIAQLRE